MEREVAGRAPRVLLTTYAVNDDGRFTLPAPYVECVRRAGGVPILVAPGEERLDEVLAIADAIILTGGGDVDPGLYRQKPHPKTYGVDRARDDMEIRLVRTAVERELPTLCICRGIQVLNVALKGSLIQHLPDRVGEGVPHKRAGEYVPHPVRIVKDSRLAEILGAIELEPPSSHHQALDPDRVAAALRVVAHAPDRTIEAVEMPDHPWLIGVQWHPEQDAEASGPDRRLFEWLVGAARETSGRGGA